LAGAVAGVVLAGGRNSQAKPANTKASALTQSIDALLAGIPQSGSTLGSPTAPVTLQFFGDLECPTSKEFTLEMLPSVIARWVRPGKLRIEYRSLRTATPDPAVFTAQQAAALAAGLQNKLWYYVENFYHQQGDEGSGYVTDGYLRKLAEQTPGLNVKRWSADRLEPPLAAEVAIDEQTAARHGLQSTPSLVAGRTGGARMDGRPQLYSVEPPALDAAIKVLLGRGARSQARSVENRPASRRLAVAYRDPSGAKERTPC
jgi:protein-disulfide isomerase